MFILRSAIYFILLFFLLEAVALSAVAWSFYESTSQTLKHELLLSDHRARDFTLAISKAAEVRLNPNGYAEMNTAFTRYVEETSKDPEKFMLKEIRFYDPSGLLLSSSKAEEVSIPLEKRKPDTELAKKTYFRKAMRMRKWEWPEEDLETGITLKKTNPSLPNYANEIVKFFPEASVLEAVIYAPVYHETKLDVLGAVFVVYDRGNLVLLFENQFALLNWMIINYSLIAFVSTIVLWLVFFLFQYVAKREGSKNLSSFETTEEKDMGLPLIQKRTVTSVEEVSGMEEVKEGNVDDAVQTADVIPEIQSVEKPKAGVIDAIYLG
jgi:hypothetical protein